jgi:hypothetical protein
MKYLARILVFCCLGTAAIAAPPAIPPSAPFPPGNWGLTRNDYSQMNPVAMEHWQALVNQVGYAGAIKSTPIRVPVAILGDSTCVGHGTSQTDGGDGGAFQLSWPVQVAQIMTAAGIPTQVNSVWGQSNLTSITASGYALYNTAVSVGGGDNADWSLASTNPLVAGGYPFRYTNGGSGGYNNAGSTFSFTPPYAFDTFTVYNTQHGGTFNVNVDGGSALTVASGLGAGGTLVTVPSSFGSYINSESTYSVTHGTHTINVVIQSGTTTDVWGIDAFDSTISYVDLLPMCEYGAEISSFDNTSYLGAPAYITDLYYSNSQKLQFIWANLTVNDIANGTTAASYLSSMNDLNTKWKAGTGTISAGWMIGPWTNNMCAGGGVPGEAVTAQILTTAPTFMFNSAPMPVVDFASQWSCQAISLLMGGDGVHPTGAGATWIARTIATDWLQ